MKKTELLAPAGSFTALKAAIHNGCDAVYLGGRRFGARAFADNFDHQEMGEAIAYAHRYGVKIYVTMNTLVYEDEIDACLAYVEELQNQDVDALIVQDYGLMDLIHQTFPQLELHASTQMHIHNKDGAQMLKNMGIQRAVLARETSIEAIREISNVGIDLEVFVHGALCVCYSGQCLMSARLFDRSGNRGACAQPCRMAYTLRSYDASGKYENIGAEGEFLLSPKDLYTLDHIGELIDAGVLSFKIEGRMKRPEYVAQVVRSYRRAIDAHLNKQTYRIDKEEFDQLKKVYHRGFTQGHLFHQRGSDLMNPYRPNHMGVKIGDVLGCDKRYIKIRLCDDLRQGDGIRILQEKSEDEGFIVQRLYNEKGLLIREGKRGDIIMLDNRRFVAKKAEVIKSSDVALFDELAKSYEQEQRKVNIIAQFYLHKHEKASLVLRDEEGNQVEVFSELEVEEAIHRPLDDERIITQLKKMKDTCFQLEHVDIDNDHKSIMAIRELNEMRRTACAILQKQREVRHAGRMKSLYHRDIKTVKKSAQLAVHVHTDEQYEAAKALGCTLIFSNNPQLLKRYDDIRAVEPRVKITPYKDKEGAMLSEAGGLMHVHHSLADASFNTLNSYTCAFLMAQGMDMITLSYEMDDMQIANLIRAFKARYKEIPPLEKVVYTRMELMVSRHCIISHLAHKKQLNCGLCRGNKTYTIIDKKNREFPLMMDEQCLMHVMDHEIYDVRKQIQTYLQMGIQQIRLQFTLESKEETKRIIREVLSFAKQLQR